MRKSPKIIKNSKLYAPLGSVYNLTINPVLKTLSRKYRVLIVLDSIIFFYDAASN